MGEENKHDIVLEAGCNEIRDGWTCTQHFEWHGELLHVASTAFDMSDVFLDADIWCAMWSVDDISKFVNNNDISRLRTFWKLLDRWETTYKPLTQAQIDEARQGLEKLLRTL